MFFLRGVYEKLLGVKILSKSLNLINKKKLDVKIKNYLLDKTLPPPNVCEVQMKLLEVKILSGE